MNNRWQPVRVAVGSIVLSGWQAILLMDIHLMRLPPTKPVRLAADQIGDAAVLARYQLIQTHRIGQEWGATITDAGIDAIATIIGRNIQPPTLEPVNADTTRSSRDDPAENQHERRTADLVS